MNSSEKSSRLEQNLSRRLHRALTAGKEELFQLLDDPDSDVLRNLLKNPSFDENHLMLLLRRRDIPADLLKAIADLEIVEGSHPLKAALACNPNTPDQVVLSLLPHLYLFELLDICQRPGMVPDLRIAAERIMVQRLPATPLGSKITLARRGTPVILETLLKEGEPRIVEICLGNPRLKEGAIFQFLNSPKATQETIALVARHPRWSTRPNLRTAILRSRHTPAALFLSYISSVATPDIRNLLLSRHLGFAQKKLAEDELRRRQLGR